MRKSHWLAALGAASVSMNLWTGCATAGDPTELTGRRQSALGDTSVKFALALPVGRPPPSVLAATSSGLLLGDGVTLLDASGRSVIANEALSTNIGVGAVVGDKPSNTVVDLVSTGPVTLRDRAEVTGTLLAHSSPILQNGAGIDGSVLVAPAPFIVERTFGVTFPATTLGDVILQPGKTRSLSPGAYGNVLVSSRARLTLAAGSYTFGSFDVEPQGIVQSSTNTAPLVIFVRNGLILHTAFAPSGDAATFFLGYAGTAPVTVDGAFSGTFVAPNAAITLGALATGLRHSGAFFARSLEVRPRTPLVHVPFGAWSSSVSLDPPSSLGPVEVALDTPEPPPPLAQPGDVPAFLEWAYGSRPSQVDAGRRVIAGAVGNENIAAAIVAALVANDDLGESLVAISVLGELLTQTGFQYFEDLLNQPLPTTGTILVELGQGPGSGIPLEQSALTKLQARAIDGLSLLMTPEADDVILNTVAASPSNLVRARGVHDYLFVHGDAGRAVLAPILPADQQVFLDRFDIVGAGSSYDARLQTFLAKHPELVPEPITPKPD